MKNRYGVDGVMIGRASIGYPWIFNEIKHFMATGEMLPQPTIEQRVEVCRTHLTKSIEWKGPRLGINEMRRHYSNYFKGMENFKEYRLRMVTALTDGDVNEILDEVLGNYLGVAV